MDTKGTPGNETEAHLNDLVLARKFIEIRTFGNLRVVQGYPWGGRRTECR